LSRDCLNASMLAAQAPPPAAPARPVVVRPFHRVRVVRVHAEIEDVVLREPHVLEQLPRRVLEPRRLGAALVGGNAVDGLIESYVRLFPIEKTDEVSASCIITHPMIMRPRDNAGATRPEA
jgi:hypothetical protein